MAYDKIIVIHARLDKRIDYALNEAKTMRQENGQILQTAINCQLDTAYQDMRMTKRRWDKEKRPIQGYHIIHSFAPGEVTPEQAHRLSVEFTDRLLQNLGAPVEAKPTLLNDLSAGSVFRLANRPQRVFVCIEKRRTRWLCRELRSYVLVTISGDAPVIIEKQS